MSGGGTYDCDGLRDDLSIGRTILVYIRDGHNIRRPGSNNDRGSKARRRPRLDCLISTPRRGAIATRRQRQSPDKLKVPERRVCNRICKR